jgi:hypothetical protein
MVSDLGQDLADSFVSVAARLNEEQGTAEQETQRVLLGLVVSAALRRHRFLSDAVTRQLQQQRYGA